LQKQLIVKSNLCYRPRFLNAEILPVEVKTQYQEPYQQLLKELEAVHTKHDYNASDPNNYALAVKEQVEMCLAVLQTPTPPDSAQQLERMVRHCERWDQIYGYDARELYPELQHILDQHGYQTSG
jgi:hypothetical protein